MLPVYQDDSLKVDLLFQKVVQKVATAVFTSKMKKFEIAIERDTFKNMPIWPHWISATFSATKSDSEFQDWSSPSCPTPFIFAQNPSLFYVPVFTSLNRFFPMPISTLATTTSSRNFDADDRWGGGKSGVGRCLTTAVAKAATTIVIYDFRRQILDSE